jgi:pimeloyl-ACP methyl ester carboxylesterase
METDGGAGSRRHLKLTDGRRIEYLEFGDPAGAPALYLHGTPSSACEARWLHRAACKEGVRLASVDRPGYKNSDPSPEPSHVTVAQDVVAVARELGFESFATVGFSGGAGYALAAAHVAPEAVTVVHLGGGMTSMNLATGLPWQRRLGFRFVALSPATATVLFRRMGRRLGKQLQQYLDESPEKAAKELFSGAALGAQAAAAEEYVRTTGSEELRIEITDYMAGAASARAVINDILAIVRPAALELGGLTTPVEIWHGLADPAVPVSFAEGLASRLPNARTHLFGGEGHFVFHSHAEEVVASIRRCASA